MFDRLTGAIILIYLAGCSHSYLAVENCPGTDVPNIRLQKDFNEVSIIFYYTQWSDESSEALQHFNDVAAIFGDTVYFAAIDCWHLACNCSNTLSTSRGSGYPHKWPTLMAYYGSAGQLKIQYNGWFTFRNMLNFVMNVMYPLERMENREQLEQMKPLTDGIILGFFENPYCMEYKQYVIAALKWLEHDPIRTYRFFVSFASAKEQFNKTDIKEPNLLLFGHKNNKSFAEYNSFKWNASVILRWLSNEFNDENGLLHGYNTPVSIAQKLKKQPVLAIFVNEPQPFFSYMEKYVNKQKPFSKAIYACQLSEKKKQNLRNWMETLESSNVLPNLKNHSQACYYPKEVFLKNLKFYYEINQYLNHQQKIHFTENVGHIDVNELLGFLQSTKCLQQKNLTLETSLHISLIKRLEEYLAHEQQCKMSNYTLSVVLLDTQRFKDYLDSLSIMPTQQSMATVFIVDNQKENIFVMEDRFAMFNLMEFVKQFYSSSLTNYFKNKNIKPFSSTSSSNKYDILLKELNRDIFLKHLQSVHNQTLVVLIYSPDCALCGNIQHSFMQLTLLLQHVLDLRFIRINVMDNALPWQFNMPFLPALLVFPQNRFSESRLFPTHLKPDIRNLFGFILSQLPANLQVRLVVAMCQSEALAKSHTASCWQFAKTILMQHIGKHLHYWQIFEAERSLIFERLRAFKDLSLDVQRNLRL